MAKRRGRGEGGIEELPSGRYRAVLVVRVIGGKRDRLTETFDTKTDAAAWLAEKKTQYRYGKLAVTSLTVGEYLSDWLKRRTPTVEPGTATFYQRTADRLQASQLAPLTLRKLTRPVIEAAIPTLGTVDQQRKALGVLRIVLNEAVRDGILPSSPAKNTRQPKANAKRLPFWTADEVGRILQAADGEYLSALFWLGFDSGMRPGELLGLHWPEVDLDARTIRVSRSLEDIGGELRLKEPKSKAGRRTIRIGEECRARLIGHREVATAKGRDVQAGPVFVGQRSGGLITHSTFYGKYYRPVIRVAGVPWHNPYALRHTCATLLLAAGVGIKVVSERLGHEDILTTLRHYAHVLPDAQEKAAAEIDRIIAGVKVPRLPHGVPGQENTSSEVLVDW